MSKLLMISGDRALAQDKRGAFYNTLEEFHKYWDRIDIIIPYCGQSQIKNIFDNVFIHISPWPIIFQPWFILKKGLEIFKQNKFDLITVQEYAPFYNGIGARMLWNDIKVPYILEIHHITGYLKPFNFKEWLYLKLFEIFIKTDSSKATAIRVVNQKEAPDYLIKCGIVKEKIAYIPSLYIDLDTFKPLNLEKKYDLSFVGRLASNKGLDLFLETVKKLNRRAIIVGDGPLRQSLELRIKNLELKNIITLYGWAKDQTEIAQLLNQSKILLMTSYSEGGPRVVVEAMACGVPVLATPVGVVPDLIKSGESGEIIDWDVDDISKKANKLLNDQSLYEKYRQNGLEIAKRFEKKEAIKNYAEKLASFII